MSGLDEGSEAVFVFKHKFILRKCTNVFEETVCEYEVPHTSLATETAKAFQCSVPVSYTHLDVYKRQLYVQAVW